MKTLVATTGRDTQIMEFIPSIRGKGQYEGDIFLLDYDMLSDSVEGLKKDQRIVISKVNRTYQEIVADRFRAYKERLKNIWQNYDVIVMCDGDLEFFQPIAPLLELAKEKICYVKEPIIFHNSKFNYTQYDFPDKQKIWDVMKDELMVNTGMLVGPAKLIWELTCWIAEMLVIDHYWGSDQLALNAMIFYYKTIPMQEVPMKWNFLLVNHHLFKDGKVYNAMTRENPFTEEREIAIFHKIGTTMVPKTRVPNSESSEPKTFKGAKYSTPPKF